MALSPDGTITIILAAIFVYFLGTLFVALRFYARRLKNVALAFNDYAAAAALVR